MAKLQSFSRTQLVCFFTTDLWFICFSTIAFVCNITCCCYSATLHNYDPCIVTVHINRSMLLPWPIYLRYSLITC